MLVNFSLGDNTRNLLSRGSYNNPLKNVSSDDLSKEISKSIKSTARNIQNPTWAKHCANSDQIDSVIFSADGKRKYWFNPTNKQG